MDHRKSCGFLYSGGQEREKTVRVEFGNDYAQIIVVCLSSLRNIDQKRQREKAFVS